MSPRGWDRTGCREQVCICHDDSAPPYANPCRWCGCREAAADNTSPRTPHLRDAEIMLRAALRAAKDGKAPRLADAIRHAIKSAGGALRHADHDAARARRQGGTS